MTRRWSPAGHPSFSHLEHDPPEPGTLLANDRTLYRVIAVHELDPSNWDERDRNRMVQSLRARDQFRKPPTRGEIRVDEQTRLACWDGKSETWPRRPRAVEVQPMAGGKRVHYPWPHPGWAYWYSLDEHHPVCASCGELYPCREVDAAKAAAHEMRDVEKLMAIGPGCCWHCGEPITSRQAARTFPGENLLLPGAPSPAFHARRTGGCGDAAFVYEKRWRAARPDAAKAADLFDVERS